MSDIKRDFIVFFPECSSSIDDIWPDKDSPDNPTAADVLKRMQDCGGSALQIIGEWNLLDSFEVIGPHDKETYR